MRVEPTDLPHRSRRLFLTDGGLETTLIFQHRLPLPEFAAFILLESDDGCERLRGYYRDYLSLARENGTGFVLESPTYRASRDWGRKLGYSPARIAACNRSSIALLAALRDESVGHASPILISGALGPRGDGYRPGARMTPLEAERYHGEQIATLAGCGVDMVTAFTTPYVAEAIGIANAAAEVDVPVVIGFTAETDGRLPSGETLEEAIERVDESTGGVPAYYMVNCAHPTHFRHVLSRPSAWTARIGAIRANASRQSHAQLDQATSLDAGDPAALGAEYVGLLERARNVNVVGGCCGTDRRHVEAICRAVQAS